MLCHRETIIGVLLAEQYGCSWFRSGLVYDEFRDRTHVVSGWGPFPPDCQNRGRVLNLNVNPRPTRR